MKYVIKYIISLLFFTEISYGNPIILRFHSHITSKAASLGEVVLFRNAPQSLKNLLLDAPLKKDQIITKQEVIAQLNKNNPHFTWVWEGKNQTIVHPPYLSSTQDLINKAKAVLENSLNKRYEKSEIIPLSSPRPSSIPISRFNSQLNALETLLKKRICVWLIYQGERIPIWFSVKVFKKVLVANHPLSNQQVLSESLFKTQVKEITGLKASPVNTLNSTFRLRKNLKENQILTKTDIEPIPLITSQQKIKVSLLHKNIALELEGIALSDGNLNEVIPVKNSRNQKNFLAKVIGLKQAEMKE